MSIENLRNGIDEIDSTIIGLLNQRCELARQIGHWKKEHNLPIYVPERERQLLENLAAKNPGPLDHDSVVAIYREIMAAAIKFERPMNIAFLGPEGTFSHQAVLEKFGHGVICQPVPTIADVFAAVSAGRADYGMVPVENSTEGVINPTLDSLAGTDLKVVAEFNLPIHLLLYSASPLSEIRCVYSHAQPLGQCREYLRSNLPNATLIEATSSSRAVELAARERDAAAISGKLARDTTDLPVIAENIEDNLRNITRFLVIGKQENKPTGQDKTSLCFSFQDRAGALYDALRPFRDHDISMTMIVSRPLKSGHWEYRFFVDILGHIADSAVAAACAELKENCTFFKVFGSYPRISAP